MRGFPPAVLCFPKITRPYLQEACAHFFPARFQLSVRLSSESELFGIVHLAVLSFLCAERNFSTTKIWGERHGLSGMIFIPNGGTAEGSVEVSFNPFQISVSSNPAFELRKETEIGPRERFVRRPCSIVAARQFDIVPIANDWRVRLNDTVTRDSITIRWRSRASRVDQEEIPFMVIGEVKDAVPLSTVHPPLRPVVDQPSDIMRRRSGRAGKAKKKS